MPINILYATGIYFESKLPKLPAPGSGHETATPLGHAPEKLLEKLLADPRTSLVAFSNSPEGCSVAAAEDGRTGCGGYLTPSRSSHHHQTHPSTHPYPQTHPRPRSTTAVQRIHNGYPHCIFVRLALCSSQLHRPPAKTCILTPHRRFLPYTVHFEIDSHGNSTQAQPPQDVSDHRHIHAPKPLSGPSIEKSAIFNNPNSKLLQQLQQPPPGFLAGASPSPPISSSPITSGFKNPHHPNASAGQLSLNQEPLNQQQSPNNNDDFFYKHPLRASSSNLASLAPLGETETDVLKQPGKSYVLRKNQSFSYIQPRSRADTPNKINSNVVEGRSTPNAVGTPSLLNKRSYKAPPSTNLLKVASYNNVYNLNASNEAKEAKQQPSTTGPGQSNLGFTDKNDKDVPYGGFSNPNIGQNMLHDENIFDNAPWSITDYGKGNGGLRNAINFAVEENEIHDVKWIGTTGMATDALSPKIKKDISDKLAAEHNSYAVFSDDFTFQGHYKNFCKQILWPTLHYQVPDNPKSKAFEDHSWKYYKAFNEIFADTIAKVYKEGDIIWIHDYHLLLLPQLLRDRLGPNAKIGFFLHTAFPSSEVFRCLAQRKNLLLGMIGANSIGFQIPEYCRHFLQTCNRILLADVVNNEGLLYDGKYVHVYSTPVGIDTKKLAKQLDDPSAIEWGKLIQERWAGKQLIVGRDKLDRLRGVKQKLLAYEIFLKQNPEFIDKTVLIQICLKSNNADTDLESEIMLIVERINSLSTDFTVSQPVVFLNQDIDFQQYLALLSNADTFIVSTMREGMNLTCHEFIVATEKNKPPLILSEFTGSASIFEEGALLINPWNLNQIAKQIYIALTMPKEEKTKRWDLLYQVLRQQNCYNWINSSLKQINLAYDRQQQRSKTKSILLNNSQFIKIFNNLKSENSTGKRVFVIDFDEQDNGNKIPSAGMTNRKLSIVSDLANDPYNAVFIMSYLKKSDLDIMYGRFPNVGLISENGAFIKFPKFNAHWVSLVSDKDLAWMDEAVSFSKSMTERLPGSYLEVLDSTVRFHTEKVDDQERAALTISDCVTHINETFEGEGVHATLVKDLVVVQQPDLLLKAISAILTYFEKGEASLSKYKLLSSSTNSSPISQPDFELFPPLDQPLTTSTAQAPSTNKDVIDLLIYISSSNPVTEPAFEYCNNLSKEQKIDNVFSVATGQEQNDTSAMSQVDGVNKLLTILSSIT